MKKIISVLGLLLITAVFFVGCGEDSNPTNPVNNDTTLYFTKGNQVWLKKYLNVATYANGDSIKECNDSAEWFKAYDEHVGVWRWNFDSTCKLYNGWAVVDPRGLAPIGQRLADTSDIILLAKQYNILFRPSFSTTQGLYVTRTSDFFNDILFDDGFFDGLSNGGKWNYLTNELIESGDMFWLNTEGPSNDFKGLPEWLGHRRIYTFNNSGGFWETELNPKILLNAYPIRCLKN